MLLCPLSEAGAADLAVTPGKSISIEQPPVETTMPKKPAFRRLMPRAAVDRLEELYVGATSALADALDCYIETREPPTAEARAAFRYPSLRIHHHSKHQPQPVIRRAYAKLQVHDRDGLRGHVQLYKLLNRRILRRVISLATGGLW
mgnify:CR=1 FL=1